ncbi:MAG: FkbM family methyltransferase [Desulfosudaceae bacterium]
MPVQLDIPGLKKNLRLHVHGNPEECVSRQIREYGIWEAYETSLFLKYLRPGGVFLDIGANIGYYTVLGAKAVGEQGRVIAYEPDRANFVLLEKNLRLNGITNATAFAAAVSDYNGRAALYLSPDNRGDHRLYASGDARRRLMAEVVDGGEHLRTLTGRVDFIKIDTQGSEFYVLKGLQALIRANRKHLVMVVEFWPFGLRLAGASADELLDLLAALEMAIYIIDHLGRAMVPMNCDCLRQWVRDTEADPGNEGFMNLLLLPAAGMTAKEFLCSG